MRQPVPLLKFWTPLALAAALVLLTAGCGGSGQESSGTPGSGGAAGGTSTSQAAGEAAGEGTSPETQGVSGDGSAEASGNNSGAAAGTSGAASPSGTAPQARKVSRSPVFSLPNALSATPVSLRLSAPEAGAVIHYTLDGPPPVAGRSPVYRAPLELKESTLVRALAVVAGQDPSAPVQGDYTIGEVWAAPGGSGEGRRTAPLGSLSQALEKSSALGNVPVRLRTGEFTESLDLTSAALVTGGYGPDFRRASGAYTLVTGLPRGQTSKREPGYALKTRGAVASAARFEGIHWQGPREEGYSAAYWATEGSAPTFVDCRFTGGSGAYSYGIMVTSGARPVVIGSLVDGGPGDASTGVSLDGAGLQVTSSLVVAGRSSLVNGTGASLTQSSLKASSTVFAGGKANINYGIAAYNSQDVVMEGCTLWGGEGNEAVGLFISQGRPRVTGSLIGAGGSKKSLGIHANYGASLPASLEATSFLGASGGLVFSADNRKAYALLDGEGRFKTPSGESLEGLRAPGGQAFPGVLGAPDFQTPTDLSLPPGLTQDRAEKDPRSRSRTNPWTPGAYELDK